MTDGAKGGGDNANVDKQQPKQDANVNKDGGNKEAEALKTEIASRDKKIAELLDEKKKRDDEAEKQRQAALSTEEKLAEVQAKLAKNDLLAGYLAKGFNNEQALNIIEADSEIKKAELIAKYSSEQAIEKFKQEQLSKVKDEPKPKDTVINQPSEASRKAIRDAAGLR